MFVGMWMTRELITVDPAATLAHIAATMARRKIRRLPVVENDQLVGIVSIGDLAVKEGKDSRTGDTLQEISAGVKER